MKIHYYESSSGKNLIYKYIDKLSVKEQVDGYSVLEYLENDEWDKVQYKQWHRKVFEVYFYKHNRIFYVISNGEALYCLHACRKQTNKNEEKDKTIVMNRAKELGKLLGIQFV